jgi:hypothetical protein
LPVTPLVVLLRRRVDVHRIDGTLRPSTSGLAARSILRFALRQLGGNLGITRIFPFRTNVPARHASHLGLKA